MGSYAESLLSNGERVVIRERQHWLAIVLDSRYAILGIVVAIALVIINLDGTVSGAKGVVGTVLGYAILVLVLGALLWIGWVVWNWYNEDYMVTNRRVLTVSGVLNKHAADSSLEKINDAELDQNFIGRIFGYGDLDILTAADTEVDQFKMLNRVVAFKREMLNQKHELEFEGMRPPVSPPLRTPGLQPVTPPPGPANPTMTVTGDMLHDPDGTTRMGPGGSSAPTMAPPRPAAPRMSAAEVTQTLANLADLRDRGAITVQEYEAKKADLLARL